MENHLGHSNLWKDTFGYSIIRMLAFEACCNGKALFGFTGDPTSLAHDKIFIISLFDITNDF